jgi:hypothetical protein
MDILGLVVSVDRLESEELLLDILGLLGLLGLLRGLIMPVDVLDGDMARGDMGFSALFVASLFFTMLTPYPALAKRFAMESMSWDFVMPSEASMFLSA